MVGWLLFLILYITVLSPKFLDEENEKEKDKSRNNNIQGNGWETALLIIGEKECHIEDNHNNIKGWEIVLLIIGEKPQETLKKMTTLMTSQEIVTSW